MYKRVCMFRFMEKNMKVNVEFDTVSKKLSVSLDDKKMSNVSEVLFIGFGKNEGAVEIRQSEFNEEEKVFKVTKVMADEVGKYDVQEKIVSEEGMYEDFRRQCGVKSEDLTKCLFPHRREE